MGATTEISWADATQNLWWGCQEVGDPDGPWDEAVGANIDPACHGCYARVRAENPHWWGKTNIFPVWGQDAGRRYFSDAHYLEPLKWNRAAGKAGTPARVFCMSMGDWAEGRLDQKPILDKWLWPTIEKTPWLIWLLLTKRPQLANSLVPQHWRDDGWPPNAWPGTTAVTQKWWDIRIPHLMRIPAHKTFVSIEPQMEIIDMDLRGLRPNPSWIIGGGQSGKNAVPLHPALPRSLRDQCKEVHIPFHFKQWGEWRQPLPGEHYNTLHGRAQKTPAFLVDKHCHVHCFKDQAGFGAEVMLRVGKKSAGRLLDGRTWDEVPSL